MDKNYASEAFEDYVNVLVQSVQERLLILLAGTPAIGGIDLKGTLQQQEPLKMNGTATLQTTTEHWHWENCRLCLEQKCHVRSFRVNFLVLDETTKVGW